MGWWPSILPSHREIVSVNYLPHLLHQWNHPGVYPPHLEAVADADVAAWVGARGEIPVVSAHAATGRASRGSRFARECARLRDLLAG
ncbi:hypothetical protein ACQP2K_13410 [Microbispora siamensis]